MAKKTKKSEPKQRRQRRSVEQVIADLEARIAAVRRREAQRKAKADPALRHTATAMKAVEKALGAAKDAATKKTLGEARVALASVLEAAGAGEPSRARRASGASRSAPDLSEALLKYVRSNPGQRGEQISAALDTDSGTLRPFMKRLIAEGKIETAGQKRGMTYTAV